MQSLTVSKALQSRSDKLVSDDGPPHTWLNEQVSEWLYHLSPFDRSIWRASHSSALAARSAPGYLIIVE